VSTHIKFLKYCPSTARLASLLIITLAVFFSNYFVARADSSLVSLENGLSDLVFQISRSIVTVEASEPLQTDLFAGSGEEVVERLISSGIIIDSSGHIVIAASSVAGRERIIITCEGLIIPAKLKGIDYRTGLAILETNQRFGTPVNLVSRSGCAGKMVIALGNAFGLSACPTLGFCAGSRPDGTVQFTASITSGMVGGGLFDLSGRLVGVITGGIGSGEMAEVGLAVPVHRMLGAIEHLLTRGDRLAGYVGVSTADIEIAPGISISRNEIFASSRGNRHETIEKGTVITEVVVDSPASKAGLRRGDLIFSANNFTINSALDLMNLVQSGHPGDILVLGFIRQNIPHQAKIRIGRKGLEGYGVVPSGVNSVVDCAKVADSLSNELKKLSAVLKHLENRIRHLRH